MKENSPKVSQFEKWLVKTAKALKDKGRIVRTDLGDVQVVCRGKGPPVLILHGGFGGWDQGELVANNLRSNGFRTIVVSRPGYLATPLPTDPLNFEEMTAREQADLMIALLDALKIRKVTVLGFSAGAPVAYEMGLHHPDRVRAVVLESIGASPKEDGFFYAVLGAILATETDTVDFVTYMLHLTILTDYYSAALEVLPMDTNLTGRALDRRIEYVIHDKEQYEFLKQMLIATIPLSPRLLGTLNDFLGVEYWTDTFIPPPPGEYCLPTLIIQAINDNNGYYPTAISVHKDLPTSKLISVRDSGHFIWLGPSTNQWENELFAFLEANH